MWDKIQAFDEAETNCRIAPILRTFTNVPYWWSVTDFIFILATS